MTASASSSLNALNAAVLHQWMARARDELNARRAEINSLNVFPVPDSDTGSNMAHTIDSAVAALPEEPEDLAASARALAQGAVRGARGNSGLVLSQILRAVAHTASQGPVDAQTVTECLATAVKLVDSAIAEPVEGTVITVLRAAAIAARESTEDKHGLLTTLRRVVAAARQALAATPSQLPALRHAGVVDAGGSGLLILLETLLDEVSGAASAGAAPSIPSAPEPPAAEAVGPSAEIEVMLSIEHANLEALEAELRPMGNSLIIGKSSIHGEDAPATIHIHSTRAGEVIECCYRHGAVSNLRLEVLPAAHVHAPGRLIVALAQPGTIGDLYTSAGVSVIEPSETVVSDIIATVRRAGAAEVILLPNGLLSRRELISVEKAGHAFSQAITLIPTRHLADGIAALAVHDADAPLGVATFNMTEAANAMRTAVVETATQATFTTEGSVAAGEYIAHWGPETVATGEDLVEVIARAVLTLSEGGRCEQLTILLDADLADVCTEDALRARHALPEDVEIMVYPARGLACTAEVGVE
ncbi:DAK2 domain-containing protein [Corynebacterium uropygiale]|uniref:DAK2 domain-containing protein n=1 Tax=Corynebacterium uropygiale TaxID=1775911 RepID=A0A9X1QSJ5_9CORY|nr:DAK2 domain-containing protein [Corynebacterium uropygiale]MCF4007028.1 DAK2 domain-containing protein [Corynebacterium uropygiale]